jgi:hypothetical protein
MNKKQIMLGISVWIVCILLGARLHAQNLYVINDDGSSSSYSISDVRRITLEQSNLVVLMFNGDSFSFPLAELTNYQYNEGSLSLDNTLDLMNDWSINLYPNPVNNKLTLNFDLAESAQMAYDISDLSGKIVSQKQLGLVNPGSHEIIVLADELPSGTYMFNVHRNGRIYSKKVIKN